jgi:glycosyltransferase involved in cell wall biosynthesis
LEDLPGSSHTVAGGFFNMTVAPQRPVDMQSEAEMADLPSVQRSPVLNVALLTAGRDRPYALGMASALAAAGTQFDFIGSDEVDSPELHQSPQIRFLNLRGEQSVNASLPQKMARVLAYYARLMGYAFTARPKVFHILWNNKFEWFDRTALMLLYKLLGKKIVFTAHNVNTQARDGRDSFLNRATLKFQYRRCDHIFLHTEKMKAELVSNYGIPANKATVIPFGLNSTVPVTALTTEGARQRLGLGAREKVLLFFGNIAPYKGVEYLVDAFIEIAKRQADFRLIIAGRPKGNEEYWAGLQAKINASPVCDKFILKIEFVPDAETEVYFKAADVLILPYTNIFQSGVLFLGYNFGLPAIAADVGSLKEEIVEGRTGYVFQSRDTAGLVCTIENYFAGDLYAELRERRQDIRDFARERYSWSKVARMTTEVYARCLNH